MYNINSNSAKIEKMREVFHSEDSEQIKSLILNFPVEIAPHLRVEGFEALIKRSNIQEIEAVIKAAPELILYKHCTPALHLAAKHDNLEAVKLFLAIRPDLIDYKDPYTSDVPLEVASRRGHLDVAKLLFEIRTCSITTQDVGGKDVSHYAVSNYSIYTPNIRDIIKLFLGVNQQPLDVEDCYGYKVMKNIAISENGNNGTIQWFFNHILSNHMPKVITSIIYSYLAKDIWSITDNYLGNVAMQAPEPSATTIQIEEIPNIVEDAPAGDHSNTSAIFMDITGDVAQ